MFKYLSLVFYCLLSVVSNAQNFAVTQLKMNVFYIGVPNPITAIVENMDSDDIRIEINNGKIESTDKKNIYWVWPDTEEKAIITLVSKKGDTIGRSEFRVKQLPHPTARVAGRFNGTINKNVMGAQLGIISNMSWNDIHGRSIVQEYTCIVMRGKRTIYSKHHLDGPKFNKEVKNVFDKLKADDKIVFCFIKCRVADKSIRAINPIELTITE